MVVCVRVCVGPSVLKAGPTAAVSLPAVLYVDIQQAAYIPQLVHCTRIMSRMMCRLPVCAKVALFLYSSIRTIRVNAPGSMCAFTQSAESEYGMTRISPLDSSMWTPGEDLYFAGLVHFLSFLLPDADEIGYML